MQSLGVYVRFSSFELTGTLRVNELSSFFVLWINKGITLILLVGCLVISYLNLSSEYTYSMWEAMVGSGDVVGGRNCSLPSHEVTD